MIKEQMPNADSSGHTCGNTIVVGMPERSFKFRSFDDGKMIYFKDIQHLQLEDYEVMRLAKFFCNVRNDSKIMQFTGSFDASSKEIYEGDIIYIAGIGNCAVVFSHAAWSFEDKHHLVFFNETEWSDVGNILGNVFETPKLLG